MSRPCSSRKNMHSVMSNSGFGTLTIHTPEGVTIVVPQKHITKTGHVKKNIMVHAQTLTRENAEYLESKGIRLFVGKGRAN